MTTRRIHSREFKLAVCRKIECGEATQAAIGREHLLAPTVLNRWCEEYRATGERSFLKSQPKEPDKDRRIEQLEQALGQAYLDIKILREALSKKGLFGGTR